MTEPKECAADRREREYVARKQKRMLAAIERASKASGYSINPVQTAFLAALLIDLLPP